MGDFFLCPHVFPSVPSPKQNLPAQLQSSPILFSHHYPPHPYESQLDQAMPVNPGS